MSSQRQTFTLGAAALVGFGLLVVLSLSGTLRGLVDHHATHEVTVDFANSKTLRSGDEVRIDGVAAGKVRAIRFAPATRTSRVTVALDDSAGRLYADARASVRWKTLLGGHFYLALERGSKVSGPLTGPLPASRTSDQVELDDVTSAFDGGARKGLQTIPPELARALRDPASTTDLLRELAAQAPDLAGGLDALRGTGKDDDLKSLVAASARTARALDRPADALTRLMSGAAATLTTVGARRDDLARALVLAPATMDTATSTFARLEPTLQAAHGLLSDLRQPAGEIAPALRDLRPTLTSADRLLRDTRPLVARALPAARSLAMVAPRASALLTDARPSVDRLSRKILPALNRVDPDTQRSTATMIGGTFSNMGAGIGGQMDANGHFIRFPATVGSSPVSSLPCQTYLNNPDKPSLLACESLAAALTAYLTYQPLSQTPGTEPSSRRKR
jgi:phospholipid/cholesterol/gamma-HCH transport system substrate-binding protein